MEQPPDLSFLVGRELESVVFVRDYMQLVLNDAVFSFMTLPMLYVDGDVVDPDDPTYHRTACGPISARVTAVRIEDGFLIVDIGQTRYRVSLLAADREPGQGESATLDADASRFWAW